MDTRLLERTGPDPLSNGKDADARIAVIEGAGLFSHEERPADVAQALLPTLTGTR